MQANKNETSHLDRVAKTAVALEKMRDALHFYADPATYFACYLTAVPPHGSFAEDAAPLSEKEAKIWDDYRAGDGGYFGKMARDALIAWSESDD